MSETPRNDDEQFRDPTAPSFGAPRQDPDVDEAPEQASSPTEQVPTGSTQQLPVPPGGDVPPPPPNPYAASPAPGTTPPPSDNPYAAPPAPGASGPGENPYASPSYPTQGQVQAGQSGGYGPPPPGYGQSGGYGPPPPGGYATPRQMSGNTIALLVVAGLTTLGCGFGIVALIFAIIAATKSDQPAEQAKFTRWGWIAEVVGLVFVILAVVLVIIFGFALSSSSSSGY